MLLTWAQPYNNLVISTNRPNERENTMNTTFVRGQRIITSDDSGSQTGRVTDTAVVGDEQHVSITWDTGEQVWFTAEMLDILGTTPYAEMKRHEAFNTAISRSSSKLWREDPITESDIAETEVNPHNFYDVD